MASPWSATLIVISVTAVMYFLSFVANQSVIDIPPPELQRLGGNLAALSLTGDPWRLFTSIFLHAGLMHLLLNLYMLFMVGKLAEHRFGQSGMLAIYLVGGVWASYASACWLGMGTFPSDPSKFGMPGSIRLIVSVGASGAIMALCGAVLMAMVMEGEEGTGGGKALAQVVGINVLMGFFVKGVDQAAHLGGIAAGAALGATVGIALDDAARGWAIRRRMVLSTVVAMALLGLLLAVSPWPQLRELRSVWDEDEAAERQREDALKKEEDALSNLWMARRKLIAMMGQVRPQAA
jgi:membrane associated rhomboid family serine protease